MVAKELGNGLDLLDMINDLYILLIVQPYKVHPSPEWGPSLRYFKRLLKSCG